MDINIDQFFKDGKPANFRNRNEKKTCPLHFLCIKQAKRVYFYNNLFYVYNSYKNIICPINECI